MPKSTQVTMSSDHDLLIVLNTKMDVLSGDVKEVKDGTAKDIEALKRDKMDLIDAEKQLKDHETRIRSIEIRIWVASGIVIACQVALAIYSAFH